MKLGIEGRKLSFIGSNKQTCPKSMYLSRGILDFGAFKIV